MENCVHGYGFKPSPIFHKCDSDSSLAPLYMGVELETDGAGTEDDNARAICTMMNEEDNENYIYAKEDSSLSEGIEFVSHPMTLAYHKTVMNWSGIMSKAINLGYKSHNAGTCGLHVHVSRYALGNDYLSREETTARLVYFYEKFFDEIVRFSRRKTSELRWAGRYNSSDDPEISEIKNKTEANNFYEKCKRAYSRYHAVNILNSSTVEFRIFKGTLKYNTFIATLEFVNEVCEFAKTASDEEFYNIKFIDLMRKITAGGKNPELIQYLGERGFELEVIGEAEPNPEVLTYTVPVRNGMVYGEDIPEDIRKRIRLEVGDVVYIDPSFQATVETNCVPARMKIECGNKLLCLRDIHRDSNYPTGNYYQVSDSYLDYRDLTFMMRNVRGRENLSEYTVHLYTSAEINVKKFTSEKDEI